MSIVTQTEVALSLAYTTGEYEGATGTKPDLSQWSNLEYQLGYLIGVKDFYDRQVKKLQAKQLTHS